MKLPVPAPQLNELLNRHGEQLGAVLEHHIGPEVKGAYMHWDELRHRMPPQGLTSELWWLGTKLARSAISRTLPLVDGAQVPFRISISDSMQRRLHYIDREAAGAIRGTDGANDGFQNKFLIRSLIEEAMTSSQLEGAATTRVVAKEMLSTGRAPRDHSERMIYNNYTVMRAICGWGSQPLTVDSILEVHRMLTHDAADPGVRPGQFRRAEDNVQVFGNDNTVLHTPPPASQVPARLQALCDFANSNDEHAFTHPVVKAIALHFQIGYDHPFCDGNGRTARAIFYWSMLKSGYWMTEYLSISSVLKKAPAQYIRAYLHTESDGADLSYFIAQQLEVIEKAIKGLHAYISRKNEEKKQVEKVLRGRDVLGVNFNHRQRAVLANAIQNPETDYTVASHMTAHRISYPTALNDLNQLENHGLLVKGKSGKASIYSSVPMLSDKLGAERK